MNEGILFDESKTGIEQAIAYERGELDEQIWKELLDAGLSGEELLSAFEEKRARIRPAVEVMLAEAEGVARGNGKYFKYGDIFK